MAEDILIDQDQCSLGCHQHVDLFKNRSVVIADGDVEAYFPKGGDTANDPFHVGCRNGSCVF